MAVSQACRLLEVSRSGYYANAAAHQRRLGAPIVCAAGVHLKAAFAASHETYGSRMLRVALAGRGMVMGRHRVRTLVRLHGLRPVWRREFVYTTDSKHTMAYRSMCSTGSSPKPCLTRVWVCDLTYIRTHSGWLYLAAVLDCCGSKSS